MVHGYGGLGGIWEEDSRAEKKQTAKKENQEGKKVRRGEQVWEPMSCWRLASCSIDGQLGNGSCLPLRLLERKQCGGGERQTRPGVAQYEGVSGPLTRFFFLFSRHDPVILCHRQDVGSISMGLGLNRWARGLGEWGFIFVHVGKMGNSNCGVPLLFCLADGRMRQAGPGWGGDMVGVRRRRPFWSFSPRELQMWLLRSPGRSVCRCRCRR